MGLQTKWSLVHRLIKKLWPELKGILLDNHVVIYNASFDIQFFPANLGCAAKISCAMLRFAKAYGEHQPHYGGYKWHRLEVAARHVGHKWTGDSHRALADAMACRMCGCGWKSDDSFRYDNLAKSCSSSLTCLNIRCLNSLSILYSDILS